MGTLIAPWAGAKLLLQCFSPLPHSEDTPKLGAAAASGSVGTQGASAEPPHSHCATSPGQTWGQLSQGPSVVPWEASFLSAFTTELPWGPCHVHRLLQAMGDQGGVRTEKSGAAMSPCPCTVLAPAFTWLPMASWATSALQLGKVPLSFQEPSGEDRPSYLSPDRAAPDQAAPALVKFTP